MDYCNHYLQDIQNWQVLTFGNTDYTLPFLTKNKQNIAKKVSSSKNNLCIYYILL